MGFESKKDSYEINCRATKKFRRWFLGCGEREMGGGEDKHLDYCFLDEDDTERIIGFGDGFRFSRIARESDGSREINVDGIVDAVYCNNSSFS